jgi:competence protein ComEC
MAAVATHNDLDHLGGLYEVAQRANARGVYLNHGTVIYEDATRAVKLTAALPSFAALSDRGTTLAAITEGNGHPIGAMRIRVLAPDHAQITRALGASEPNLASVVMRLEIDQHVVLLGGDAPEDTWRRLLDTATDHLGADVWLFPHHGAELPAGLLTELLDAVEPSFFIISVGTTNRYGHPALTTLTALAAAPGRLMCTQVNRHCLDGGALPRGEAENGLPEVAKIGAGLRSTRSCPCAGSVRFVLSDAGVDVSPGIAEHRRVTGALRNAYSAHSGQ